LHIYINSSLFGKGPDISSLKNIVYQAIKIIQKREKAHSNKIRKFKFLKEITTIMIAQASAATLKCAC
jgi:hypothetical protein